MKLMRLAICVAAFAVIGGIAFSEDVDVRALQARLADVEAKLNSRAYPAATDTEAVVSLRKNATVKIGGTVNTRYWNRTAKIDGYRRFDDPVLGPDRGPIMTNDPWPAGPSSWGRRAGANQGFLQISDAKLEVAIDVNEYFDAYLKMDLQSSNDVSGSDNAECYYVRWKNVCNTGFGLLVGRNALAFGQGGYGVMGNYTGGSGDGIGNLNWLGDPYAAWFQEWSSGDPTRYAGYIPAHNNWDIGRIVQVTPYWEGMDGRLKIEASVFQWTNAIETYRYANPSRRYYKSHDFALGNFTGRVNFKVFEGFNLQASVVNFYNHGADGLIRAAQPGLPWFNGNLIDFPAIRGSDNNTAIDLGFTYRPAFFNKLNVWANWVHGWNVQHIDNLDSDAINAGFSYDFTEAVSAFIQGDYLRTKGNAYKGTAYALYGGLQYRLPYGVTLETGWKHEWVDHKILGTKVSKGQGDSIYGHLGFDF